MPVQIGTVAHSFADPTGLLSDCHRRIEMFLGSLEAVARVIDRPLNDEVARTLQAALRYFREAAPKHTADEEESLFPRLRKIEHADATDVLTKMQQLEDEHRDVAPLHDEVERLGQSFLAKGNLSAAEVEAFRAAVKDLQSIYREHIAMEDREVFPVAARLLTPADQAAIAREMAARRQVPIITDISAPVTHKNFG